MVSILALVTKTWVYNCKHDVNDFKLILKKIPVIALFNVNKRLNINLYDQLYSLYENQISYIKYE